MMPNAKDSSSRINQSQIESKEGTRQKSHSMTLLPNVTTFWFQRPVEQSNIMPHDTCAEIGLWIEDSLHELVYRNSSEVESNRPLTSRPILNLLNWAISATVVRAMILGAEFSRNQHARRVWTLTTAPHPHIPVPCLGLSFFLVARISAFRHCDEAVWKKRGFCVTRRAKTFRVGLRLCNLVLRDSEGVVARHLACLETATLIVIPHNSLPILYPFHTPD